MGKRRSMKKLGNRVGKKGPPVTKATASIVAHVDEKQLITDDDTADEHPFKIGHYLVAKYRDDSHRLAKIIEKSGKSGSSNGNDWRYYIHYVDFNRRMDEWVTSDRIVMLPSEANPMGVKAAAAAALQHDKKSAALNQASIFPPLSFIWEDPSPELSELSSMASETEGGGGESTK
jgi:hypothetical protein